MSLEITQELFNELEQHHGSGNVIVLTVAGEEFAFRRPSRNDVELTLEAYERKEGAALEQCAVRCLLAPLAPAANQVGCKTQPPAEVVELRARLAEMFTRAEFYRDWVGLEFATHCGWNWTANIQPIGSGVYEIDCQPDDSKSCEESVRLTARRLTAQEYAAYRRKHILGDPDAKRFVFGACITSANKSEAAARYPFLVEGIGTTLVALGTEAGPVRVKKFKPSATAPGTSTKPPAEGETSP